MIGTHQIVTIDLEACGHRVLLGQASLTTAMHDVGQNDFEIWETPEFTCADVNPSL